MLIAVALDNSPAAAREWVYAADPRPTYPVLLDSDHRITEIFGIVNVPSTVWIDEAGTVVRPPVIAPGDDTFKAFTNVDSSVHHEQLRDWVLRGALPFDAAGARDRQMLPTPEQQQARIERRLGAFLHRTGRPEAATRHLARAAELAPMDWTVQRGSMPLRGEDPFGPAFFDFYQGWEAAGRPGYGAADES